MGVGQKAVALESGIDRGVVRLCCGSQFQNRVSLLSLSLLLSLVLFFSFGRGWRVWVWVRVNRREGRDHGVSDEGQRTEEKRAWRHSGQV